ncbi:hypothetical protein CAPTEDRAFT_182034 [Capitella teleta]|uniref:Amino acid transporter n=1 Tax=Capitella teleta TaxID=283909 RepID=R7VJ80_CAPTE|nr:hypothetical protein CAPTEDRAFT_182034 [Capitella teleta]|eukprot:ELU16396.1 hypothetical protein CAPTEDRAFT_182034 [Capitella teleta]
MAGAGCAVGWVLSSTPPFDHPKKATRELGYLFFPAELILRALSFVSLPLIVSSIASSLGALDYATSSKVMARVLFYFVVTGLLAMGEAVGISYAIRPGKYALGGNHTNMVTSNAGVEGVDTIDFLMDFFRNLLPDNFITAAFQQVDSLRLMQTNTVNILGLVVIAVCFGFSVASLHRRKSRPFLVTLDSFSEVSLKLMRVIVWFYPILVFFMTTRTVILLSDSLENIARFYVYILTICLTVFTHSFVILPLMYLALTRKNPLKLFLGCFRALLITFATRNRIASLPATMDCLENLNVSRRLSRLVAPLGASINLDGLVICEVMTALLVVDLRAVDISAKSVAFLAFAALGLSFCAQSSGAGVVLYVMIFQTVGLPMDDIAVLVSLDWLVGRIRTATSVWSDCVGAGIVQHFSRRELLGLDGGVSFQLDGESVDDLNNTMRDGVAMTNFKQNGSSDWTVRLVNESGEQLVVSKV